MQIHIVLSVMKMLNYFPTKGGVSDTLSPKTIMSGVTLDYKKNLCLQFGQYCQVHEEENPRNSQAARTRGAIFLGPSGNLQGGFQFMALNTGKKITRHSWTPVPMPDVSIARVNALGSDQPEQLIFTDRHGRLIGDVDIPGVDAPSDDADAIPGVDGDEGGVDEVPGVDPEPVVDDAIELPGVDAVENEALQQVEIHDLDRSDQDPAPIEQDPAPIPEETVDEGVPETPLAAPVPTEDPDGGLRCSSQVRTKPKEYVPSMTGSKYAYAVSQLEDQGVLHPDAHTFVQQDFYSAEPNMVAAIMTELSLKRGLREWGDRALSVVTSKMKQLHMRDTFKPLHWKDLSHTQHQMVLESHLFLKEK